MSLINPITTNIIFSHKSFIVMTNRDLFSLIHEVKFLSLMLVTVAQKLSFVCEHFEIHSKVEVYVTNVLRLMTNFLKICFYDYDFLLHFVKDSQVDILYVYSHKLWHIVLFIAYGQTKTYHTLTHIHTKTSTKLERHYLVERLTKS